MVRSVGLNHRIYHMYGRYNMWLELYDRKNSRVIVNLAKVSAVEAPEKSIHIHADKEPYRLSLYSGPKIIWTRSYNNANQRDADYDKIVDIIASDNMVSDVVLNGGEDNYETHYINLDDRSPANWMPSGGSQVFG